MGIKIVREPSETPNINNTDDFVPFRYAYGNQDGYVIGKGNEVNIEQVDTNSVLIKSGRFVVQGVEVDINANGEAVAFDDVPQNSDVFVTVYAEVSLATNSVNMQKVFDTVDYPVVDKGDDLTHTTNGTANIEIAHIKISNGSIVSINKKIKPIEYNLRITKDTNGVLRIGDTIIPQKKLLLRPVYSEILSGELLDNKILEIVLKDKYDAKYYCKVYNSEKGWDYYIVTGIKGQGILVEKSGLYIKVTKYVHSSEVHSSELPSPEFDGLIVSKDSVKIYEVYEIIE